MAGSVNKVILVGNLGKDPKVANLNSGDRAVSFTLATSETWKDKNSGERRERTEWHNVVVYNENIGRVVELLRSYADRAQFVVITHQKRTMEAADALYGVTMAPGGSSKVLSQRVRREGGVVV